VVPCGNGYSLSRCLIVNNKLAWPQLRERFNSRFCSVETLRYLYEIKLSVVEHVADHIEDTKGLTHLNSKLGTPYQEDSGAIIASI
jgi:hypothetical protein